MNWLGSSFPDAMNRLPLVLAVLFFALYAAMLWLLLFRRPSFRKLSGLDRWSVLTASYGVMPIWMFLCILLIYPASFLWGQSGLLFSLSAEEAVPRGMLVTFCVMVLTWPITVWVAFRIALRRLAKYERRLFIVWLFSRISAAFVLAFLLVWLFFHFAIAGGHSFDHITEFGPRNLGGALDWASNLDMQDNIPVYSDAEYRDRFPVRKKCRLCRFETILGKNIWAEAREKNTRSESHAESAVFAESESHAESAENSESEVEDGSASRPGEEGLKE